jgi:predicted metal-binding membrane protein
MGLLASMAAYLFTAFTLQNPSAAPFASFIGGSVTFLVGWFCMSLVDDVYVLPQQSPLAPLTDLL